jgi:hypothetical protein
MDNKSEVKKSVLQIQKDFGRVFPIAEIFAANPEINEDDVRSALEDLVGDGIVSVLDDDTIQVNV